MIKLTRAILLLVLVGFGFSACQSSPSSNQAQNATFDAPLGRIYNGVVVDPLQAVQIVEIQFHYEDGSPADTVNGLCSGFVVGTSSVLTAGHCFRDGATVLGVMYAGNLIPVTSVVVAPDYREDATVNAIFGDVAVVQTATAGLSALPILASVPVVPQSQVVVYGYGLGEDGVAGVLRAGPTTLETLTPSHFLGPFFDGEGTNSCAGDSGGPAIQLYTRPDATVGLGIVAMVSSGLTNECGAADVTLFTNLQNPQVLDFIRSQVPDVVIE